MRTPSELAHYFADIMNSRDATRFVDLVAEDYINHNPFVGQGRTGGAAFMTHWFEAMSDLAMTVEEVLVDGDKVYGRFKYPGTHTGNFASIPASGASVTMRSIDTWRVRDGLFVEHWDELNLLEVFQKIGAATMAHAA